MLFTHMCTLNSQLYEQRENENSQGVWWMVDILIEIYIKACRGSEQTHLLHKVLQLISLISV